MANPKEFGLAAVMIAVLNPLPSSLAWPQRIMGSSPSACSNAWAGIYPTVLTPYCSGGVDIVSLEKQLHHELTGGVHGLLVLGTIGEGALVSGEERRQVIATAVRSAGPARPVIVGIHTCSLDAARNQLLQAKQLGAAAVLVKYAGHPNANAEIVLGFFAALSEINVLPIFYYHYPSQTGLQLKSQDIANILSLPHVVGIKESTFNLREVQAHIALTRGQGKTFLSGTALNLTQFLNLGGHGALCPEAVLLPVPTVQAYAAYMHGYGDEARAIQAKLFALTPILRDRPSPQGLSRLVFMSAEDHKIPVPMGHDQPQARLKAALSCLGISTSSAVKCPLPPLSACEYLRVQAAVVQLQKIDWCEAVVQVPAEPLPAEPGKNRSGMLLKTGAIQVGPNVGKSMIRWQGDGKSGF
jgi:dihydrodipicolinate synthase/N-acetylneuraminate lyase